MRALVTGADGFIGSHLVDHLLDEGHTVRGMVLHNTQATTGWLAATRCTDVVSGDVRDATFVRHAMHGCDTIFHLAALVSVDDSYRCPQSFIDTNVTGTLHVLQAAREQMRRVVYVSSSEVYGNGRTRTDNRETDTLDARSPYAASKVAAEHLALTFHYSYSLPVVVVRPFNTFGPRQGIKAVLPSMITRVLNGERTLAMGNVTTRRDFCYVSDTARGIAMAAGFPVGSVTNLGRGSAFSITEAAQWIGRTLDIRGIRVRQTWSRPAASEVRRLCAFTDCARERGFTTEVSFMDGIERTADWWKSATTR